MNIKTKTTLLKLTAWSLFALLMLAAMFFVPERWKVAAGAVIGHVFAIALHRIEYFEIWRVNAKLRAVVKR